MLNLGPSMQRLIRYAEPWKLRMSASVALLTVNALAAQQIPVRYTEGVVHGFLVARTLEGKAIADGELSQVVERGRTVDRLTFGFHDGSTFAETTVFSQRGQFRLLSDHLVETGPSFKHAVDMSIDVPSSRISVGYTDDQGARKVATDRHKLPPDLANGLLFILLKNMEPSRVPTKISMVVATPKPRLISLVISQAEPDTISVNSHLHQTTHFVVKTEVGGVAEVVAPLLGKQPPDTHVWILKSESPTFIKFEGPLFQGGPIWRIELASPDYSRE
jgi:hypothetical protein